MNISVRQCEIDLSRDKIVVTIEKDGQIYRAERGWIAEAADSDEFCAVADIRDCLEEIFKDMY